MSAPPNIRVQRVRSSASPRHPAMIRRPPGTLEKCRSFRNIALISLLLVFGSASRLIGQCGFPWTVTAQSAGGQTVAVRLCGTWVGCFPHNPQFSVADGQINVTLTAAELPSCICTQAQIDFDQIVLVSPVQPGTYAVTANVIECGQVQIVGTGTATVDAASAIPALDRRGAIALAALLSLAALWILRA